MWLARCAAGTVVRFRHDVTDEAVQEIEALLGDGRQHVGEYLALLGATQVERRLTFVLRDAGTVPRGVPVIASGTPAGDDLMARVDAEGMPAALTALGFADAAEFWEPWCAALSAGTIVSVAFAARLSPVGAEAGVATVPKARGFGFAATVTAAWSAHPSLAGRARFYTTDVENRSSRRVAERLGLRLLGPSTSIT